ncbi:hypothetical protein EYZ11_001775 [Aspergillus tanneri]|uniref:Uncharacterized protein n=1 Tax=Aspergillus tanneri TaxID=1220188 RepID=A0A4S3JSG5_9EURO|nr:hypothetical protein EYZ11_001775 [Aspergillus tanneri]
MVVVGWAENLPIGLQIFNDDPPEWSLPTNEGPESSSGPGDSGCLTLTDVAIMHGQTDYLEIQQVCNRGAE